jgi:hypothetical protein
MIRPIDFITEPAGIEWVVSASVVPFHLIGLGNRRQGPGHWMFAISLGHLSMAADAGFVPDIAHVGTSIAIPSLEGQARVVVLGEARRMKGYLENFPYPGENPHGNQKDNTQPDFPGTASPVGD